MTTRLYKYIQSSGAASFHKAILLLILTCMAAPVYAQGFMVQPMRMEATLRPGQSIELPLALHNTSAAQTQSIDLRLVELTQTGIGYWHIMEPGPDVTPPHDASCVDWIMLPASQVNLSAATKGELSLQVSAPHNVQGSYFAALLAESPRPPDAAGLIVRVRFLIPIILHIQGRPVRQQIELAGASLAFQPETEEQRDAKTTAHIHVANKGRTLSRVEGWLQIERKSGEQWRPVTRLNFADRSILPNLTLELGEDLDRNLPSGLYRLRADLSVDGRRVAPLMAEVDLEGDPSIDTVAYDTALIIEPEIAQLELSPGATRSSTVVIQNPGDSAVNGRMTVSTPKPLQGMALGELTGEMLSAESWTEIRPAEFTIRPGGRQSIRVMTRVPREELKHANYYADLNISANYGDGQSAGGAVTLLHVHNSEAVSRPAAQVERILLAEGESPSEYIVQARLTNVGNVHIEPYAIVQVLTGRGTEALRHRPTGDSGPLLPLGKRTFSGVLDFSSVAPGYYVLRATVEIAPMQSVVEQLLIEVTEESVGDATDRMVTVITEEEVIDLPDGEILPDIGDEVGAPLAQSGQEASIDDILLVSE